MQRLTIRVLRWSVSAFLVVILTPMIDLEVQTFAQKQHWDVLLLDNYPRLKLDFLKLANDRWFIAILGAATGITAILWLIEILSRRPFQFMAAQFVGVYNRVIQLSERLTFKAPVIDRASTEQYVQLIGEKLDREFADGVGGSSHRVWTHVIDRIRYPVWFSVYCQPASNAKFAALVIDVDHQQYGLLLYITRHFRQYRSAIEGTNSFQVHADDFPGGSRQSVFTGKLYVFLSNNLNVAQMFEIQQRFRRVGVNDLHFRNLITMMRRN